MSLYLLLLLLLCGSLATNFYGTVMTFYPSSNPDGSVRVVLRYKLSFRSCTDADVWDCAKPCETQRAVLNVVDQDSDAEWCQREGIITQQLSTNAPFLLRLDGGNWTSGILNGVSLWRALTLVDLRNRSDTGQANRSPQTTVLPALRVPSNCRRDFDLLAFDPDGDEVKCRHGNTTEGECNPCTPPSVLRLSTSCTLSFPTTNSGQGLYAVQLVMEDFPRQNITLVQTSGSVTTKTTSDPLSKLPVQFVLRVDPAVPSCTEGHYLPKFLPPTPANRARLYASVSQTLEILINAEAINSTVSELLFSGPHSMTQNASGAGQFSLSWTPSKEEEGQNHPICFIVQAVKNSAKYHSALRCVIVSVTSEPATTALPMTNAGSPVPGYVLGLKVRLSSDAPMTEADIKNAVTQQLKDELIKQGFPPDIALWVITSSISHLSTAAPPAGSTPVLPL